METAAVGGSATAGDTVSITVYDAGLSGGSKTETYTVLSGDSPQSIATGLAGVINGDSSLSSIGISATAVSAVVNIVSTSINSTTYSKTLSGGATETLTLAYSTGNTQSTYNNLNELTATSGGGATRFAGTTNKPIKSATVNGSVAATLPTSTSFNASPLLSSGNNSTTVAATDGANNMVTNPYQVSVKGGPSATLTYDANGNMTSDGTNSYAWDAENRMIQITYPGSDNNSTFTYDPAGKNVSIVEVSAGTTTSTKQFVWCSNFRSEERDAAGSITGQYFQFGEIKSGSAEFWTTDHLNSVREITDGSGNILGNHFYDSFGRESVAAQTQPGDFGYVSYYRHVRSGLGLTMTRTFNPMLGRWTNRDLFGGPNPYYYVLNQPTLLTDPLGLFVEPGGGYTGSRPLTGLPSLSPEGIKDYTNALMKVPENGLPDRNSPKGKCIYEFLHHALAAADLTMELAAGNGGQASAINPPAIVYGAGVAMKLRNLCGRSLKQLRKCQPVSVT